MTQPLNAESVNSDTILGLSDEEAPAFVSEKVATKSLSATIKQLNSDVLSGDPVRRDKAARALKKLGFD